MFYKLKIGLLGLLILLTTQQLILSESNQNIYLAPETSLDKNKFRQLMMAVADAITKMDGFLKEKGTVTMKGSQDLEQLIKHIALFLPNKDFTEKLKVAVDQNGFYIISSRPQPGDPGVIYQFSKKDIPAIANQDPFHAEVLGDVQVRIYERNSDLNRFIDALVSTDIFPDLDLSSLLDPQEILEQVKKSKDVYQVSLLLDVLKMVYNSLPDDSSRKQSLLILLEQVVFQTELDPVIQDVVKSKIMDMLIYLFEQRYHIAAGEDKYVGENAERLKEIAKNPVYSPHARTFACVLVVIEPLSKSFAESSSDLNSVSGKELLKIIQDDGYLSTVREMIIDTVFEALVSAYQKESDALNRIQSDFGKILREIVMDRTLGIKMRQKVLDLILEDVTTVYTNIENAELKRDTQEFLSAVAFTKLFNENQRIKAFQTLEDMNVSLWKKEEAVDGEIQTIATGQLKNNVFSLQKDKGLPEDQKKVLEEYERHIQEAMYYLRFVSDVYNYNIQIEIVENSSSYAQAVKQGDNLIIRLDKSLLQGKKIGARLSLVFYGAIQLFQYGRGRESEAIALMLQMANSYNTHSLFNAEMQGDTEYILHDIVQRMASVDASKEVEVHHYLEDQGYAISMDKLSDIVKITLPMVILYHSQGYFANSLLRASQRSYQKLLDSNNEYSLGNMRKSISDKKKFDRALRLEHRLAQDQFHFLNHILSSEAEDPVDQLSKGREINFLEVLYSRYPENEIFMAALAQAYIQKNEDRKARSLADEYLKLNRASIPAKLVLVILADRRKDKLYADEQARPRPATDLTALAKTRVRLGTGVVSGLMDDPLGLGPSSLPTGVVPTESGIVTVADFRNYFDVLKTAVANRNDRQVNSIVKIITTRIETLQKQDRVDHKFNLKIRKEIIEITANFRGYSYMFFDFLIILNHLVDERNANEAERFSDIILNWIRNSDSGDKVLEYEYYSHISEAALLRIALSKLPDASNGPDAERIDIERERISKDMFDHYMHAYRLFYEHQPTGRDMLMNFGFVYYFGFSDIQTFHQHLLDHGHFEEAQTFGRLYLGWQENFFRTPNEKRVVVFYRATVALRETAYQLKRAGISADEVLPLRVEFLKRFIETFKSWHDAIVSIPDKKHNLSGPEIQNYKGQAEQLELQLRYIEVLLKSNFSFPEDERLLFDVCESLYKYALSANDLRAFQSAYENILNFIYIMATNEWVQPAFSHNTLVGIIRIQSEIIRRFKPLSEKVYDPTLNNVELIVGEFEYYHAITHERLGQLSENIDEKIESYQKAKRIYDKLTGAAYYIKFPPAKSNGPPTTIKERRAQIITPTLDENILERSQAVKTILDELIKRKKELKDAEIDRRVRIGEPLPNESVVRITDELKKINTKNFNNAQKQIASAFRVLDEEKQEWPESAKPWIDQGIKIIMEYVVNLAVQYSKHESVLLTVFDSLISESNPEMFFSVLNTKDTALQHKVLEDIFKRIRDTRDEFDRRSVRKQAITPFEMEKLKNKIIFATLISEWPDDVLKKQLFLELDKKPWIAEDIKPILARKNKEAFRALVAEKVEEYEARGNAAYLITIRGGKGQLIDEIQAKDITIEEILAYLEGEEVQYFKDKHPQLEAAEVEVLVAQARSDKKSYEDLDSDFRTIIRKRNELKGYIDQYGAKEDQEGMPVLWVERIYNEAVAQDKEKGQIDNYFSNASKIYEALVKESFYLTDDEKWGAVFILDEAVDFGLLEGRWQLAKGQQKEGIRNKADVAHNKAIVHEASQYATDLEYGTTFTSDDWKTELSAAHAQELAQDQFLVQRVYKTRYQKKSNALLDNAQLDKAIAKVASPDDFDTVVRTHEVEMYHKLFPDIPLDDVQGDMEAQSIGVDRDFLYGARWFAAKEYRQSDTSVLPEDQLEVLLAGLNARRDFTRARLNRQVQKSEVEFLIGQFPDVEGSFIEGQIRELKSKKIEKDALMANLAKKSFKNIIEGLRAEIFEKYPLIKKFIDQHTEWLEKIEEVLIDDYSSSQELIQDARGNRAEIITRLSEYFSVYIAFKLYDEQTVRMPVWFIIEEIIQPAHQDKSVDQFIQYLQDESVLLKDALSIYIDEELKQIVFKINGQVDYDSFKAFVESDEGQQKLQRMIKLSLQSGLIPSDIYIETDSYSKDKGNLEPVIEKLNREFNGKIVVNFDVENRKLSFVITEEASLDDLKGFFEQEGLKAVFNDVTEVAYAMGIHSFEYIVLSTDEDGEIGLLFAEKYQQAINRAHEIFIKQPGVIDESFELLRVAIVKMANSILREQGNDARFHDKFVIEENHLKSQSKSIEEVLKKALKEDYQESLNLLMAQQIEILLMNATALAYAPDERIREDEIGSLMVALSPYLKDGALAELSSVVFKAIVESRTNPEPNEISLRRSFYLLKRILDLIRSKEKTDQLNLPFDGISIAA